jgi:hypothetical protein
MSEVHCQRNLLYNTHKIGLFYHAIPDRYWSCKDATLYGSETATDCINVLHCSKMSGTDKWKLLLGKMLKLIAFKGFEWILLPVLYYANTYCHDMTYIWKIQELSITTQLLTAI